MDRYICIHGHFYQPPRENPWLEYIELQDAAYPHHDWNEKVTQECYRQNAASRILGPDRKIIDIVNNYASISFDFGPTLLHWLALQAPDVYEKILEADRQSREVFSGHSTALACAYNHIILPLANTRDKHTQVIWAIRDFEARFRRFPEGMWLPETAVDIETLEVLAEHGIKFTILAPRQAKQVRKIGVKRPAAPSCDGSRRGQWQKVDENSLDIKMPYLCNLPSGKSISLFFYHGPTSADVAYGGLLHSGEAFAAQLSESFQDNSEPAQLVHIATDGESFGHHHRHGDMALAYCLHYIQTNELAKITTYGEFLEKFPPSHEVEIWENSSWSCAHGLERWRSNCGCCADQSKSFQQQWRAPLRQALDQIRDKMAETYQMRMSQYCSDPWGLRNEYITVVNDRTAENVGNFIRKATGRDLPHEDKVTFLKLLEMQRMAMLMYTSCGWFFDDISGLETVQIMQYAARAMQLHHEVTNIDLLSEFKNVLKEAPARTRDPARVESKELSRVAKREKMPLPSQGQACPRENGGLADPSNGEQVYRAYVEPTRIDLHRVGAHFALSCLFEESPKQDRDIYCYSANMEDFQRLGAGIQTLATGRATIQSNITLEKGTIDLAVLHLGDHNLMAALTSRMPDEDFHRMRQELSRSFRKADTNEVMRQMNIWFAEKNYSLWHLFKDQQRRILYELLENTWQEIESSFRHFYEHNYAIMLMIRGMNMPLPKALSAPAEFVLNQDLCSVISSEQIDLDRLQSLADDALRLKLTLDETTLSFVAGRRINQLMSQLKERSDDVDLLAVIERALCILSNVTSDMDLQAAQNVFFSVGKEKYQQKKKQAQEQDKGAVRWVELFESLSRYLGVVVQADPISQKDGEMETQ
ncbi:MAG: DUF3536 domain-containing protein [Sedimentisphaerales bacterium]